MATFIEETEEAIKHSGHTTSDIEFIGDQTRHVELGNWDTFKKAVDSFEKNEKKQPDYNSSDSGYKACRDLIIAFEDGSLLFREGYVTSEQWDYLPSKDSAAYDAEFLPPESAIQTDYGTGCSLIQKLINLHAGYCIDRLKNEGVSDWNIQTE